MQDLHVTHSVGCKSKDAGSLRRGTYIKILPRQRCSRLRDHSTALHPRRFLAAGLSRWSAAAGSRSTLGTAAQTHNCPRNAD